MCKDEQSDSKASTSSDIRALSNGIFCNGTSESLDNYNNNADNEPASNQTDINNEESQEQAVVASSPANNAEASPERKDNSQEYTNHSTEFEGDNTSFNLSSQHGMSLSVNNQT